MSTLTKTLVILLTISSFLLCGIVVTYVSTVTDYKMKCEKMEQENQELESKVADLTKMANDAVAKQEAAEEKMGNDISSLKSDKAKLASDVKTLTSEKEALVGDLKNAVATMETMEDTKQKNADTLKETLEENATIKADLTTLKKELQETTIALQEKMAIIDTLEAENKGLVEEKVKLQDELELLLRPTGQEVPASGAPGATATRAWCTPRPTPRSSACGPYSAAATSPCLPGPR